MNVAAHYAVVSAAFRFHYALPFVAFYRFARAGNIAFDLARERKILFAEKLPKTIRPAVDKQQAAIEQVACKFCEPIEFHIGVHRVAMKNQKLLAVDGFVIVFHCDFDGAELLPVKASKGVVMVARDIDNPGAVFRKFVEF